MASGELACQSCVSLNLRLSFLSQRIEEVWDLRGASSPGWGLIRHWISGHMTWRSVTSAEKWTRARGPSSPDRLASRANRPSGAQHAPRIALIARRDIAVNAARLGHPIQGIQSPTAQVLPAHRVQARLASPFTTLRTGRHVLSRNSPSPSHSHSHDNLSLCCSGSWIQVFIRPDHVPLFST